MTTVSRSFRHPEPAQVIDVRCSATMPSRGPKEGRCQLFAGHSGPHAVMFGRDGERLVRTWQSKDPASAADTGTLQRPWMFGFPVPAWFETEAASRLSG
jgi:hypothetical protein